MSETLAPAVGDIFVIPLKVAKQVADTTADVLISKVPWKCRTLKALCGSEAIGGSPTAATVMLENGTTDIFSAEADIKTPASPTEAALAAAQMDLAEGDVLHVDVTFTGGTSPTADGVYINLYCVRT